MCLLFLYSVLYVEIVDNDRVLMHCSKTDISVCYLNHEFSVGFCWESKSSPSPFFFGGGGGSVAVHFSPILFLISMGIAVFIMPNLVWNFSGLVLKVTRPHLSIMITMLGNPGHLSTESFRLFCSSTFAGELAEVFFN